MDPDLDLELSAMMETSVKDLCVPVAVIVAESGRRGRRRKLVRRLRIAGTTLAVAAVAIAGANAGLPLIEAGPRTGTEVGPAAPAGALAAAPPTPSPTPTPSVDPTPRSSPTATGTDGPSKGTKFPLEPVPVLGTAWPNATSSGDSPRWFTEGSVSGELKWLLAKQNGQIGPAYPVNADRGDGASAVYLAYADGDNPVTVELRLGRTELPFPADGSNPAQPPFRCGKDSGTAGNHSTACLGGYLPNGSWELVETNDARVTGLYSYRVAVWYPNGTVVDFTEYAGFVHDNGEPPSYVREKPPIDFLLWRSVTESPVWTYYVPVEGTGTG